MHNTQINLYTLSVGIYMTTNRINVCILHFNDEPIAKRSFKTTSNYEKALSQYLAHFAEAFSCSRLTIMLIAASPLGFSLANELSIAPSLIPYSPLIHCLPGTAATDTLSLSRLAHHKKCCLTPWRGPQYLALQKLTRRRYELIHTLIREKVFLISQLFRCVTSLPFSAKLPPVQLLTRFLSPEQLALATPLSLITFLLVEVSIFTECPPEIAYMLAQAERNSFRLGDCPYTFPTIVLGSCINCIASLEQELLVLEKLIERTFSGLSPKDCTLLFSVEGMDTVTAAGILSEIGSFDFFPNPSAFLLYIGKYTYRQLLKVTIPESLDFLRHYLAEALRKVYFQQPEDSYPKLRGLKRPVLFPIKRTVNGMTKQFMNSIFN